MARYAILNTVDWAGCQELAHGRLAEEEAMQRLTGCVWLFRVESRVDDVEQATRDAVREFFSSAEGRRELESDGSGELGWNEALQWVPDAVWQRHGLEPIRHPEVERVLLRGEEDLREEVQLPQAR